MPINRFLLPVLTLVSLLGAVLVAKATGDWSVSGKSMVELESLASSDEIRGWMTLQNIMDGFGMERDAFYAALSLPPDLDANTALKDVEKIVEGFEVGAVREVVDAYLAGGELPQNTPPPQPEAAPTSVQPTRTPTAVETTPTPHAPQGPGEPGGNQAGAGDGGGPTPLPEGSFLPAAEIKGRTTLQEIATYGGIPLATLIAELELPAEIDPNTAAKDLVGLGKVTNMEALRAMVEELQK